MSKSARDERDWGYKGTMKLPKKQPPPYVELTPPHWRKVRIGRIGNLFQLCFSGSRMRIFPSELKFFGVASQDTIDLTLEQALKLGELIEGKNKAGR